MEDVNERLLVAVRLRPTSKKENAYEHVSIVARRLDSHTVITSDPLLTDGKPG